MPYIKILIAALSTMLYLRLEAQTFDYVTTIPGFGASGIEYPLDLFVTDNFIFVATDDDLIDVFNSTPPFAFVNRIMGAPLNGDPIEIFAKDGLLYVVDEGDDDVEVYNANTLAHVSTISSNLQRPKHLFVENGLLYVSDDSDDDVEVFNASTFMRIDSASHADLDRPQDIFVANGLLYVSDEGDDDIEIFNAAAPFDSIATISAAQVDGNPYSLFVKGGLLYVNNSNDVVKIFNADTPFDSLTTIGDAEINNITDRQEIFVDAGFLFASDQGGSDDVIVFDANTPHSFIGLADAISTPDDLFVKSGFLYVIDGDNYSLDIFTVPVSLEAEPIPTLSEWSLISLALLMLICGMVAVRQSQVT